MDYYKAYEITISDKTWTGKEEHTIDEHIENIIKALKNWSNNKTIENGSKTHKKTY